MKLTEMMHELNEQGLYLTDKELEEWKTSQINRLKEDIEALEEQQIINDSMEAVMEITKNQAIIKFLEEEV